jgi:hypothetical protein
MNLGLWEREYQRTVENYIISRVMVSTSELILLD